MLKFLCYFIVSCMCSMGLYAQGLTGPLPSNARVVVVATIGQPQEFANLQNLFTNANYVYYDPSIITYEASGGSFFATQRGKYAYYWGGSGDTSLMQVAVESTATTLVRNVQLSSNIQSNQQQVLIDSFKPSLLFFIYNIPFPAPSSQINNAFFILTFEPAS